MNISYANSALLGLLALVAVPLLLHLFARSRPPVYQFSSVEFLRKVMRKTMRLKKPQDYILLALRTLMFLALIGVFLKPLLFSDQKLSGLFDEKNVVVIVDASASMGVVEGAQTRFASACAEASEILNGLTSRDRANLIWIDAEPDAVFPEMGMNFGFLKDSLRRARVSSERGSIGKALALAQQLLSEVDGKREICIVSDFQREAWSEIEPSFAESIDVVFVKAGAGDIANLAMTNVSWEPAEPIVGEEITIFGEVRNFSNEAQTTTVFCSVGENRQSQNLTVGPWQQASAVFKYRVTEARPIPLTLSVSEDAFAGDDRRFQAIPARYFLNVGIFEGADSETARVWTGVVGALDWAQASKLDEAGLKGDLSEFDVILLAGWAGQEMSEVGEQTKVMVLPGNGVSPGFLAAMLGIGFDGSGGGLTKLELGDQDPLPMRTLVIANEDDALFRIFATGEHGDVTAGKLSGRFDLQPESFRGGQQLLSFADGAHALTRFENGRYLWNLPLEPKADHWAGRVEFLPLFGELLLHDRGGDADTFLEFEPGDALAWTSIDDVDMDELILHAADVDPLEIQTAGLRQFFSPPVQDPGLYAWVYRSDPVQYSPVNFPSGESDLRTMELADIEGQAENAAAVGGGADVRFLRDGMKLWPWLLAAVAVFIVMEGMVLMWTTKTA